LVQTRLSTARILRVDPAMEAHQSQQAGAECVGLLQAPAEYPNRHVRFYRSLNLCAGLLSVVALVALGLKARRPPCVGGAVIGLSEARSGGDLLRTRASPEVVADWLSKVSEHAASTEAAAAAVDRAFATNVTGARRLMSQAIKKAADRWRGSRASLMKFVVAADRELFRLRKRTPSEQASVASCTFDVMQATTQLAAVAAGINDAAKTCDTVDGPHAHAFDAPGKICALNVEQVIASMATVAASLSLAAANCAQTLVPHVDANLDALCSGAITGLIQSLMEFSIGAELTASACTDKVTYMPEGTTPSNIGSGRRLLFGGGKDSVSTFCAVDVTSSAWYLAQAGLAINAVASPEGGAICSARRVWNGHIVSAQGYKQSHGFCAVSVTGAIYGILQAIKYINMAFIHCTDTWNVVPVCSAGIDGMLAGADGLAYAGSSTWLTCDELKNKWHKLSPMTKDSMSNNVLGNSGVFGRRLSHPADDKDLAELRRRFASPEDAWQSIGIDVEADPALRSVEPLRPSPEDVLGLLEDRAAPSETGFLEEQRTCS